MSISSFLFNEKPSVEKQPPQTGVRILCLDGGGMRGIITLQFLIALEKRLNCSILNCFDLICGTSIGGIISLSLLYSRLSATQAEEFLINMGSTIFGSNTLSRASRFVSTAELYDSKKLTSVVQQYFKQTKLSSKSYPKLFVVAADCSSTDPHEFLFRNYAADKSYYNGTKECTVWEAARSTSAAPLYFQQFDLGNKQLVDGGIVANNPVKLARNEASKLWPHLPIDYIVSIGTGFCATTEKLDTSRSNPSAVVSSRGKDFLTILTSSERIHEEFVTDLLVNKSTFKYHRLTVELTRQIPLDGCDEKTILEMQQLVQEYIKKNDELINDIVSILKKN